MRGLIDNASSQEHQIASAVAGHREAVGLRQDLVNRAARDDAALKEQFEAGKLNDLVGK